VILPSGFCVLLLPVLPTAGVFRKSAQIAEPKDLLEHFFLKSEQGCENKELVLSLFFARERKE
jgi:hypothetical protein